MPFGDRHHARLHPETVPRGEKNHYAKLTETQVREIRGLLRETKLTQKEIGAIYSVGFSNISAIKKGHTWRWLK